MAERERTQTKVSEICIDCVYSKRQFLTPDNKDASRELINELDKRGVIKEFGKLVFEFFSETAAEEVELETFFRYYNRPFVTIYNKEAFNMLMKKLHRKKIVNQPGRLIFRFIPSIGPMIANQICECGHNRFAHVYVYGRRILGRLGDRGYCDVEGCKCKNYQKRL